MSSDLKRVKLMYVAIDDGKTKQSNKFYNLTQENEDTFLAEWGRVDHTKSTKKYPISKWETTIRQKLRKGYKDVTHLFKELNENDSSATELNIQNKVVKALIIELQNYANATVKSSYTVSSNSVTQIMVDEAQAIIDAIVSDLKISTKAEIINSKLIELYHVIPRKMPNVKNYLLENDITSEEYLEVANKLVSNEQDTLDTMGGQVLLNDDSDKSTTENKINKKQDILKSIGLEIEEASAEEMKLVKEKMGDNKTQAKKIFKVKNIKTDKRFKEYLKKSKNKKTELFWHGSRNQNWFNIISTGLLIRPSSAIITGAMFGHGIYFADKAKKSIGYSSLRGSYWTGGGDNKGFLALYRIHTGNHKHIYKHDSSCYSLNSQILKKEGYDSVFAHGGADLRNNEYITYETDQSTIEYLVEIG